MNTALKKINARVKVLQKRHPGKKRTTLQKQAGKEYKAGKLKPHRKKAAAPKKKRRARPKKLGAKYKVYHEVKKVGKARRRRSRARAKKPKVRTVTRIRTRTVVRRRRVGATGKGMLMTVVAVAAVVGLGYLLLKKSSPSTVTVPGVNASLNLTGNSVRDQSSQQILAYAQAASLGASALASIINSLNSLSDAAVVDVAQKQQAGMDINTLLAVPTGGPSISLG